MSIFCKRIRFVKQESKRVNYSSGLKISVGLPGDNFLLLAAFKGLPINATDTAPFPKVQQFAAPIELIRMSEMPRLRKNDSALSSGSTSAEPYM